MGKRVGILDHHQAKTDEPRRHVKKTVAELLVRRLLAVPISKHLIQMVQVQDMCRATPARTPSACRPKAAIQHHIEPRINLLTISNSEWLQYLHGYGHL